MSTFIIKFKLDLSVACRKQIITKMTKYIMDEN